MMTSKDDDLVGASPFVHLRVVDTSAMNNMNACARINDDTGTSHDKLPSSLTQKSESNTIS